MRKMFTVGLAAVMAMGLLRYGPVRLRFTKGSGDNGCTSGGRDNSRPIPG